MANPGQVKLIQFGRKQLGLSETEYREILDGKSAKDLNNNEVNIVLKVFENLGFKYTPNPKKFRDGFATPGQIEFIKRIWNDCEKVRNKDGLQAFVKRIVGVDSLKWIKRADVQKVIKGIHSL